jgi:hypothetical protein
MPRAPAWLDRAGESGAVLIRRAADAEEAPLTSSTKMRPSWTTTTALANSANRRAASSGSAKALGSTNFMARPRGE